ncbi:UDP-4-amino-4-deoxy-L-arabinose--oxoglutarate aminotransferase [Salmonella enterica subsp. arizonae]|uniref:UDP-4-amino-4-deoxy-L-arabinose--oxoglutarate aminotransferase n=1 Tax=Salmonella enterica subsp. arizonae TaxID=59203 RepID=A0A2X4T6H0_SALER|nr:UDP-4-amino-4-deoxy-L-arabinose--oxoglutarate aminotransferase [Salmonella enterica subsp. arizonae]
MSDFLPFSRPAMGTEELAAVKTELDPGWIRTCPENQGLAAEFCRLTGNQYAVAVSSATSGMHIALMALNIGEGDEIITLRAKAIIPLHYADAPADLDAIHALGDYGITVIEDAAHTTGTGYKGHHIGARAPRFSPSTPLETLPAQKTASLSRLTHNLRINCTVSSFTDLALMPGIIMCGRLIAATGAFASLKKISRAA